MGWKIKLITIEIEKKIFILFVQSKNEENKFRKKDKEKHNCKIHIFVAKFNDRAKNWGPCKITTKEETKKNKTESRTFNLL